MPYLIVKNFNDYSVINPISQHVYSKHTTLNRAKKQMGILERLNEPNNIIKFINYK